MDVTISNFFELLPKIREAIEQSDFIAIDCELTGLNSGLDINAYDTQKQYYEKLRRGSRNFLIIQYGICIFRYDRNTKVFKQQAYNFYVFPRYTNKYVPDHRFLCQASSIDFLATQKFDFNKLFKEGIPYLNSDEEDRYKKTLQDQQKVRANQLKNAVSPQSNNSNNISISAEDQITVDDIFERIEQFIAGDQVELILPRCNSYIKRLVYNAAQAKLGDRAYLESRQVNKERLLVATRLKCKEDKETIEKKKILEEQDEFNKCIGFSQIIKCLISCGKLVVGHNMCLDVLHTISQFLTALPEDYEEFKDLVNYSFTNILDTKYMCSAGPFKELVNSSVLPHLCKTVQEKPFVVPSVEIEENAKGYQPDSNKEHEAGYDAYITGISFIALWNYLGKPGFDPFTHWTLLNPYRNRLFLMRLQDSPCIHLGGDDPSPSRDHVLHITFPKEWKLFDIVQLFSPFGNIHVAWLDNQSAYVGLHKRDQAAIALRTLSQSNTYTLTSYAKRQANLSCKNVLVNSLFPSSGRKRSLDNINTQIKKQRTASVGEASKPIRKRSIEPIIEDSEELPEFKAIDDTDIGVPLQKLEIPKKKGPKKTFKVPNWD